MEYKSVTQEEKDRIRRIDPTVTEDEIEEYYRLMMERMKVNLEAFKNGLPVPEWKEEERYKVLAKRVHI